nr:MAG: UbiA prenyltransferase [Thermoproteus sp. AZ2]
MAAAASYALAGGRSPEATALLAASTFLAEAGMFAHNDVANLAEDRLNRPNAPLVTGAVSLGAAKAVSVGSYTLGLIAAAFLGPAPLAIYAAAAVLGAFYNIKGKRVPFLGNFLVAFLTSLVYIYGMAAAGLYFQPLFLLFAASLLANLGRELAKTAIDYYGDRAAGIRTAAVVLGQERAARLGAYLAAFSTPIGAYLAFEAAATLPVFAAGVAITTAALAALSYLCLRGRWETFRKGSLAAFGVTLAALMIQALIAV